MQQASVSAILRPWLAASVEHIGSTAVPGLRAKPVVDVFAPVVSLSAARAALPLLERDGWLFWPQDPNAGYRMWLLRPSPAARTHHLHIIRHDHPQARALIAFRDALRADATLRDAYADLKTTLAERHRADRDAYSDAKSAFVTATLRSLGLDPGNRAPVTAAPSGAPHPAGSSRR